MKSIRRNVATKRKKPVPQKQFCKRLQGADDVYLTRTKIAVRNVRSGKNGRVISDKTKYYPKTKENLSCASKMFGRIRNGRY